MTMGGFMIAGCCGSQVGAAFGATGRRSFDQHPLQRLFRDIYALKGRPLPDDKARASPVAATSQMAYLA
jgi:hypothetical protein